MMKQCLHESRLAYLLRVAIAHIRDHAAEDETEYDDTSCDGHCLATDLQAELDCLPAQPEPPVQRLRHRNLGAVTIDEQCRALQARNTDSTSIFVNHDDDIKEVTRDMLEAAPDYWPAPWYVSANGSQGDVRAANGEPVLYIQPLSPKLEGDILRRLAWRNNIANEIAAMFNREAERSSIDDSPLCPKCSQPLKTRKTGKNTIVECDTCKAGAIGSDYQQAARRLKRHLETQTPKV